MRQECIPAPANKGGSEATDHAIFGDIHANLEALQTVLTDARERGCTDYVCLGDVVGYNANPNECLSLVRSLK